MVCRVITYAEAAAEAAKAETNLMIVSLTADPPVVKCESLVKASQPQKTMKQQKEAMKERRKQELERRRANTFKEVINYDNRHPNIAKFIRTPPILTCLLGDQDFHTTDITQSFSLTVASC